MESYSLYIGIAISMIILLPLILIQSTQKKQKRNTKKSFIDEALKNNLKITEPDFWGTYYTIALDETANKLIYSKIIDAEHNVTIIHLSKIDSCEIVKTHRTFKNKTTSKIETDKIDLVIGYKTSGKSKDVLEFYNVDVNFSMGNEMELLQKWESKIKSRIIKKSQAA
jgi:low affinity Fe/Cu permease